MKGDAKYCRGGSIPLCMGVAAAIGCGKTHAEVMAYCTCSDEDEMSDRIRHAIQRARQEHTEGQLRSLELTARELADEVERLHQAESHQGDSE